jgi:nucleotide-binding universal stress UspA family protein
MFGHVLVPLDGSGLAEDALPPVVSLANRLGSRITLLHVIERDAPARVHGEPHATDAREATNYLRGIADLLRAQKADVELHVHDNKVAGVAVAIESHAQEFSADLIAMCKHGRSGLRRVLMGSIPERILRGGRTPILLRPPNEPERVKPFQLNNILVPLNLQHDADTAVSASAELAQAFGATVHLITALPSLAEARRSNIAARLLPSTTAEKLRMDKEEIEKRLLQHSNRLAESNVEALVTLRDAEPAAAILGEAARIPADLIILSTHARVGFDAWYTGSIGTRVIGGASQTMLLLRER